MTYLTRSLLGLTILLSAMALSPSSIFAAEANTAQLTRSLFRAVAANNLASVRTAVSGGANINAVNRDGLTAAGLAIEKGFFPIAHYILGVRNQQINSDEAQPKRTATSPTGGPTINLPPATVSVDRQSPAPRPKEPEPVMVDQWPSNKPNPFEPSNKTNNLPIVGTLQKPEVEPNIPSKPVVSTIKSQAPASPPLKITATPPRQTVQSPTPLKPLDHEAEAKAAAEERNKGVFDRMVDGVSGAFKTEEKTRGVRPARPETQPVQADPVEDEDEDDDGVINRMWNSITNIF